MRNQKITTIKGVALLALIACSGQMQAAGEVNQLSKASPLSKLRGVASGINAIRNMSKTKKTLSAMGILGLSGIAVALVKYKRAKAEKEDREIEGFGGRDAAAGERKQELLGPHKAKESWNPFKKALDWRNKQKQKQEAERQEIENMGSKIEQAFKPLEWNRKTGKLNVNVDYLLGATATEVANFFTLIQELDENETKSILRSFSVIEKGKGQAQENSAAQNAAKNIQDFWNKITKRKKVKEIFDTAEIWGLFSEE